MTWEIRDTSLPVSPQVAAPLALPHYIPASLLASLAPDEDEYGNPFDLDAAPWHEQAEWRAHGLTPPGMWAGLRRLMTRGIVEQH